MKTQLPLPRQLFRVVFTDDQDGSITTVDLTSDDPESAADYMHSNYPDELSAEGKVELQCAIWHPLPAPFFFPSALRGLPSVDK